MEVLPFPCPRLGHELRKSAPIGHHRPYRCPCGQVILGATVLDYLEPRQDRDGKRAAVVVEMIDHAWNDGDLAPFINTVEFDRRLAARERSPNVWRRLFGAS